MKTISPNNKIAFFFLIILGLLFYVQVVAQAPAMRQYTVEDGLPSSNIYAAIQTQDGFMWFGTDKGLVRFDGYRFKVFDPTEINNSSEVWGMVEDRDGRIWCSTFNNILYFEKGEFQIVKNKITNFSKIIERYDLVEAQVNYIFGKEPHRLYKINSTDSLSVSIMNGEEKMGYESKLYFLKKDQNGTEWFSAHTPIKFLIFKYKNGIWTIFKEQSIQLEERQNLLLPFLLADKSFLFFSSKNAFHFDFKTLTTISFQELLGENLTVSRFFKFGKIGMFYTNKGYQFLTDKKEVLKELSFLNEFEINTLYQDRQKNLWICTPYSGIYFLSQKARNTISLPIFNTRGKKKITAFTVDNKENIWLGLNNGNLLKIDSNLKVSTLNIHFQKTSMITAPRIKMVNSDTVGNIYLNYNSGIFLKISENELMQKDLSIDFDLPYINNGVGYSYKPGSDIWGVKTSNAKSIKVINEQKSFLATSYAVFKLNFTKLLKPHRQIIKKRTYAIAFLKDTLWLGNKEGLFFVANHNDLVPLAQKKKSFNGAVSKLENAPFSKLWVVLEGKGLFRYDGTNLESVSELCQTNETISTLFPDGKGNLWTASNQGIAKISIINDTPFEYKITRYSLADGLPNKEVIQAEVKENVIYALTTNGLTILKEQKETAQNIKAPLAFTGIKINNQSVNPQSSFDLTYNQNNITFEYAALSFESLQEIHYQYKMEGIDENWQETQATQKTYNTLVPGDYVFHVKTADDSGIISEEQQIEIFVLPPWWQTKMAYFSYFLLLFSLMFFIIRVYYRRKLELAESYQIKELDNLKNQLFANITHEFRTPLTIMLGMKNKMKTGDDLDRAIAARLIEKHGSKLLGLVNQMLDLIKLQSGGLDRAQIQRDILLDIHYVVDSFRDFAAAKKIDIKLENTVNKLVMDFYAEHLQTCLLNLLSNALKYTPAGGTILITTKISAVPADFRIQETPNKKLFKPFKSKNNFSEKSQSKFDKILQLSVVDSGQGITKDDLPNIFNRFYKGGSPLHSDLDSGTGIGLALTKELTEQMGGKIMINSELGKGSKFTIHLPITNLAVSSDALNINQAKKNNQSNSTFIVPKFSDKSLVDRSLADSSPAKELPQLLIIEDEPDMFIYLSSLLERDYQIYYAKDGKEGIDFALEHIPDLVLSDIVMPKKNGYEVCETLKKDVRTSHIPIIFITAKIQQADRLEGLKRGADAYLTKPFDEEELLIRLKNLRGLRLLLHQRYSENGSSVKDTPLSSNNLEIEDEFITNLRSSILEHLEDGTLDVARICKIVGMSRSQLHRKMIALTGASITKFIKKIRLETAAALLTSSDLPISIIAFQTGLNPIHFAKIFKQEFGKTPTQYRKID